jgi:hypothetical protein
VDFCLQSQGQDVALYLLGKCPESFTDTRPHPAFGDRKLESLNAAIAGSYAGGAASKPKGALLDNGAQSVIEALFNYRDAQGVAVLKERFDAQVEWVRLGAAPDAGTVRYLVDMKCDVNRQHPGLSTPMMKVMTPVAMASVMAGSTDMMMNFMAHLPGQTALHEAVSNGNITVVRTLLELRADPRLKNKMGVTPAMFARGSSLDHIAEEIEAVEATLPARTAKPWGACCQSEALEEIATTEMPITAQLVDSEAKLGEWRPSKASTTASEDLEKRDSKISVASSA